MLMQEIREIAKEHGIKSGKMTKLNLIREIQRTEGNFDCFATPGAADCDQVNCLWREDCLTMSKKSASS